MAIFSRSKKVEENTAPDEATLLKYITNLTPDDIDRLVATAKDRFNNAGPAERSKSMTDYFDLLESVFKNNFDSTGNSPATRSQRYEVYDEMDESTAYISSALDILSDDATQADEDGVIIHIESDSDKVNNLVSEFVEEFEIANRISKWARAVAKYGDFFLQVEGEYGKGISYINDTIYPSNIDRKDMNGKLLAFCKSQGTGSVDANLNLYAPWEFVHFRHKGDIYKEESSYARLGISKNTYEKNLTSAYGQSILRPAIKVYSQLRFVENMMILSRLTNSIRRNIFLINVGAVSADKAFDTIANYANLLKKNINFDIDENIYSSAKHTVNYDEDIFLPVGDPQNDVRIESIGGDFNAKEQYDLEYLLNKLFSALKVPKAYLNYEQDLNARSTLIQLDIRYARSVGQLQVTMEAGLRRLINIHLAYKGLDPDEVDLHIYLTPVSAIDEEARIDQKQKQITAARDVWDVVTSMSDAMPDVGMNTQEVAEYILSNYLELDKGTIDKIFNRYQEEGAPIGRVNSGRQYRSMSDIHSMYPSMNDPNKFESIRESIVESIRISDNDSSKEK